MLDKLYVVPHNVNLIVKYRCHINVEYCNQGTLVKYLFNYINKGHDRATIVLEGPNRTQSFVSILQHEDENEEYINCRYISVSEACWKLFGFEMHYHSTTVERLPFHEENCNRVYFRDGDDIADVVERTTVAMSKFTEWMTTNRLYSKARNLTYADFPTKFTWHQKDNEWRQRKGNVIISLIYFVNPCEGEKYYLRMLLNVMCGPVSFKDIHTVDGVEHPTYMSTCKALRLLGDDTEWLESIKEASQWQLGIVRNNLVILYCY